MNNPRTRVLTINLTIVLLLPLVFGMHTARDFARASTLFAFLIAIPNVAFGALLADFCSIKNPWKKAGSAMFYLGLIFAITSVLLFWSGAVNVPNPYAES